MFESKFPTGSMAERAVPSNRRKLRRKRTSVEQFSKAVLAVRHAVKINSQQNGMIFAAIFAMNENVVCRHEIPLVSDNLPKLAIAQI
jgi:hypothetical protein